MENDKLKDFLKVAGLSALLLASASQKALYSSDDFEKETDSQPSSSLPPVWEQNFGEDLQSSKLKNKQVRFEGDNTGNFTTSEILEAANYAKLSYKFFPTTKKEKDNFKNLKKKGDQVNILKPLKKNVSWRETTFENQDTGIFVDKNDGTAVVTFKGSDRLNTWVSDFDFLMSDHEEGGRYHSGFLKMYQELESALFNQLMLFAEKNNYTIAEALEKMTFIGHSRGGGTALVAADITRRKFGTAVKVITFGAPPALHQKTAEQYDEAARELTLTIAQDNDPVHYAALPILNGVAHVGSKVYVPCQIFKVHRMIGYEKSLKSLLDNHNKGGRQLEIYQE